MVNNIEELKKLIIWAKEQKVKVLKLADIHIELSDLALLESLENNESQLDSEQLQLTRNTEDKNSAKEDEEALFWSSRS